MARILQLFTHYVYYSISFIVILSVIAMLVERTLLNKIVDDVLEEQSEDINMAINKNYITMGDTLWGSNWFAVSISPEIAVDIKKNVTLHVEGIEKHYRHIERSFLVKSKNIKIQTWVEVDISSYYTMLYILFPITLFLLVLGYIALIEFIHYKSWEQLNYVSSLFDTFSVKKDVSFNVGVKDRALVQKLDKLISFMGDNARLAKSKSFSDMARIFNFMHQKVTTALENEVEVDESILNFANTIDKYQR